MTIFRLRPHHLICSLCFCGKGYNQEFTQNFAAIHSKLNSGLNREVLIQIVDCCDDICIKCPENQNNLCNYADRVRTTDTAYINILKIKVGQVISFTKVKTMVKEKLTMDDFHRACKECSWYHLDICAPMLQSFLK